jgi:hypothetical protein
MFSNLFMKLYRKVVVLPPVTPSRILRKLIPSTSRENKAALLRHSIDQRYGIETSAAVRFEHMRSGSFSDVFSTGYAGSQPSVIRKALRMVPDHHNLTFYDLGCGKGRALAVASEFPFRRIIGVELSPFLASAARANAEIVRRRIPGRTPIEIVEGDALATPAPDGPLLIFLYHPFFRRMMKSIVRNFEKWLWISESKVYIVYCNPVYFDLFDKSRLFRRVYAGMMEFEPSEQGTENTGYCHSEAVAIWQSWESRRCAPVPKPQRESKS